MNGIHQAQDWVSIVMRLESAHCQWWLCESNKVNKWVRRCNLPIFFTILPWPYWTIINILVTGGKEFDVVVPLNLIIQVLNWTINQTNLLRLCSLFWYSHAGFSKINVMYHWILNASKVIFIEFPLLRHPFGKKLFSGRTDNSANLKPSVF